MTDDKERPVAPRKRASRDAALADTLQVKSTPGEPARVVRGAGLGAGLPAGAAPKEADVAAGATLPANPGTREHVAHRATLPVSDVAKSVEPALEATLPAAEGDAALGSTLPAVKAVELAPPGDSVDPLSQTIDVYSPAQVHDPLAVMLGVSDGVIDPDGPSDGGAAADGAGSAGGLADRYQVRDEIGRGGIGRVLLAFDPRLGREVAIKELLPRFASGKSVGGASATPTTASRSPAEVRFLDEARITAQLEHPGIVPVHELGQRADGSIYYAMRLVRGRTLSKAIRGKPLRERLEVLPNYLELCNAIAYAHSRGVVHRDLKPDNVMLGEFGETVVLDWGLAKVRGKKDRRMAVLAEEMEQLRQSSGTETVMGAPLGTPAYMPPEQAAGQLELIDARSDVYSLGAILYEILTGRAPYVGASALDVLEKVQREEIVSPDRLEGEVAPELAAICMHALRRRREDRYDGAKKLAEDVRRFQVGGLVRAHTYSAWDLVRRWVARHKAALAAVVVLAAVAAGVWWWRGYAEQRRQAEAERRRQARVAVSVEKILADTARGSQQKNWLDIYTFKLISLAEPLVERRLIRALHHPAVAVRRLAARSLGGMKSRRAVPALAARLAEGVEPNETVIIAMINSLGIIGDSRAFDAVSRARWRYKQYSYVWKNTELAFQMIPLPPLPKSGLTANQLVDRGRDVANKGDPKAAIALYTRAIALDPKLARAYTNRGIERRGQGDTRGALADYDQAIKLDPDNLVALNNRAAILRQQKRYAAALADLDRVVASGQLGATGLISRGRLYRTMGKPDLAIADYRAALKLDPRRALVHYNLAFMYRDKGDLKAAFASVNRAVQVHPRYCKALTVRAAIRQHEGDLAGALVDAEKAVGLDPDYLYSYTRRGQILLARGTPDLARADFDKAISLDPKDAWRWGARALFFHLPQRDHARALADIAQAQRLAEARKAKLGLVYRVHHAAVAVRAGKLDLARDLVARAVLPAKTGSVDGALRYLQGKLTDAQLAALAPMTTYRRAYLRHLAGLRAELAGDRVRAVRAYCQVLRPYRWSNLWYALSAHAVAVLTARAPGLLPRGCRPPKLPPPPR